MTIKTTLLATAAFAAFTMSASAATVFNGGDLVGGDLGIGNGFTDSGETFSVTYTATEALRVRDFLSVSSQGFNKGKDLELITISVNGSDSVYTSFDKNGATAEADLAIAGFLVGANESFTISFAYGAGADTTTHQYNFQTAAVPLPAGVLLLGTALGGLGLARRKKKAA